MVTKLPTKRKLKQYHSNKDFSADFYLQDDGEKRRE